MKISTTCLTVVSRLVLIVALIIFVGSCDKGSKSGYPSESDLEAINFFECHRADFERLRSIIERHPFMLLNAEREDAIPPGAFLDSPEVKTELLRLMADLRLQWINGMESDWGIRLTFLSSGMVMGGGTKSFFFSKEAPSNLVHSTEDVVPNTTESSSIFRRIAENWYLQLEWGG